MSRRTPPYPHPPLSKPSALPAVAVLFPHQSPFLLPSPSLLSKLRRQIIFPSPCSLIPTLLAFLGHRHYCAAPIAQGSAIQSASRMGACWCPFRFCWPTLV